MIKYPEIANISLVTDSILIYIQKKNRYLKCQYNTIPIISISTIYHDIFQYIDPPLIDSKVLFCASCFYFFVTMFVAMVTASIVKPSE